MENSGTDLVEASEHEAAGLDAEERKNQELTGKMIGLMAKISEYGYLSMPEIQMIYANQSYAYNVLKTLQELGLIGEFKTASKPRTGYFLRAKGYRTLEKHGKLRLRRRFLPQHYKPFIFNHRMACAKAGMILEAHSLVRDFLPESLLWERRKNDHDKLCDGEFWYQNPGQAKPARVGLEVELTLKNEDKLVDSLRDLKARQDLDQVWWLCGDKTIFRALSRLMSRFHWIAPQRHFLAGWDEFLEAKHRVELSDGSGTLYTINPDNSTLPGKPEPLVIPEPKPVKTEAKAQANHEPEPEPWAGDQYTPSHRRFKRWGLAICLILLSLASIGCYYHFKYPWIAKVIRAGELPLWQKRKLKEKEFRWRNGWLLKLDSLDSIGSLYRLKFSITNQSKEDQALKWLFIVDEKTRMLYESQFRNPSLPRGYRIEMTIEFQGSPSMRRLRWVLIHGSRPDTIECYAPFK